MSLLGDLIGSIDNTINALTGNQNILGSSGNDLINSLLGDNTLNGGAGNDTVSYTASGEGVDVNLNTGQASNSLGTVQDVLTSIENVLGSGFADSLIAGSGNFLEGGAGDDMLQSLLGGNTLDGGAGTDAASFLGQTDGVTASLLSGAALGGLGQDVLTGIESLIGSDFGDTLIGDAGDNLLMGGLGADTLLGGGGGLDTIDGGIGIDTADLGDLSQPLAIDLAQGQASGAGVTLSLLGIEDVIATDGADSVTGDDGANSLDGGVGDDTLNGGAGDDTLNGGDGDDTVSYQGAPSGVTVDLQTDAASGGAGADTLVSIEHVIGSEFGDTISGDAFANRLEGRGGDDVLNGRAANDTLDGGAGSDTASYADAAGAVSIDLAAGVASGGAGNDTLIGIENVQGSRFVDTLSGDDGDNLIRGMGSADQIAGGLGDDTLDGGAGKDVVSYANTAARVSVDLAKGTAEGEGSDTFVHVESVIGSSFNDLLRGGARANDLSGGAGADRLIGGGGHDQLTGGAGADRFIFTSVEDSRAHSAYDVITDLEAHDLIDLARIDADASTAGDQAFEVVSRFSHHAGELVMVYHANADATFVEMDVDGDGKADALIHLNGDQRDIAHFVL
jgi:Ca2+-binding RTX toxin-like protein